MKYKVVFTERAKKQLKKMKNVATIRRDKRKATKSEKKNEC